MVHSAVTELGLAGDIANIKAPARAEVGARGGVQDLFSALHANELILFFGTGAHRRVSSFFIDLQICRYKNINT
ncbi:hypothetical protein [Paenibacillus lupini]|uniref:hypothetical protein n=1 Tax=Paenibacillus lupini TaxID=1450204 RepID=UPI001FBA2D04|nr:hypothetical protein [Paenibacillus lupini]NIK26206.1 hypothetical protein [Paenibacillus lupini]